MVDFFIFWVHCRSSATMAFWVAFANFFFGTTSPDMYTKKMQRKEVGK